MDVGKYVDGRPLRYDEGTGRFDVGGSPVTAEQVIAYDRAGQLTWASDDLRNWAYQYAANAGSGGATAPPKQGWFTRLPVWAKVLFVLFYPVSIPYFVIVMWKDGKFTPGARVALTAVAAVFFLVLLSAGASTESPSSTTREPESAATVSAPSGASQAPTPVPETKSEPAPQPEPEPVPAPEPVELGYDPGMYKVGADLPPGEYVLLSDDNCYFQLTKDSTGELDSIICNDNFSGRSIVTVRRGEYLTVNGARIVPVKKAPKPEPVGGLLPAGMYKVGTDIRPGEYKIVADGSGYVEVAKDSRHELDSIVSNDNFDGEMYVTVSKGQYLKLSSASLKVKR